MPEPYDPNPLAPPPGSPYNPYGGAPTAPPPPPLGNGRQPADLGISGLGLVMQLAGTVFAGLMGMMGIYLLIMVMRFGGRGGQGGVILWMLLMAVTGIMRSLAHRSAGTRLLYDTQLSQGTALSGIKRYLTMSVIQIVVWCGFFVTHDAPSEITASLLIMFGLWPLVLAIIFSMPQFKALDQGIPLPEDKGFEGAAILMLVLGLIGLFFGLAMLYTLLQMPSQMLSSMLGMIPLLIFIMLVIRSSLHVIAGWRGVNETHLDRAVEGATRYANFGVITAFVAGGGLLLMFMSTGVMQVELILTVALVVLLLLGWPMTIRRFFGERQFADMLSGGEGTPHRRAPDMGHTTLGWLLLGFGIYTLSVTLPSAAIMPEEMRGMRGGGGDPFSMMFSLGGQSMRSPWWIVGGAALQCWAGLELIRMTDSHKLVASIYGVVATAVAIYVNLPMFDAIKSQGLGGFFGGGGMGGGGPVLLAGVAISLVMPIGTLILVNRKSDSGGAARVRSAPPPGMAPGQ